MAFDIGSAISGFVQGVVSPITTAITRHQEIAAAQHAADLAAVKAQGDRQAALITQGLAADANWESESLRAGAGWARNFELYVISIPAIMCFTPYAGIVKNGFVALSATPAWFQTAFLTIYLANYGIRLWRRQQSDT